MGTKGSFDTLFDNIKTILTTYSAAQVTAEQFVVHADRFRKISNTDSIAIVCLYFNGFNPSDKGTHANYPHDATYFIDCIVNKKGTSSVKADEAAGIRLRYLIQQVLNALYQSNNWYLSLKDTDGTSLISKKPLASVSMLPPEETGTEQIIYGARITLEIGLAWEPSAITGTTIDSISVNAGLWQALIEPDTDT